jgi:DNA-binding NarL/FixJ family response regulator
MPAFWEEVGILGPVYHLAGQGLSDREIANALNITELNAQGCVAWILHFLQFADRKELIRYASVPAGL